MKCEEKGMIHEANEENQTNKMMTSLIRRGFKLGIIPKPGIIFQGGRVFLLTILAVEEDSANTMER